VRILVVGSGAREHALCWRLAQAGSKPELFAAPGNPGIASHAELRPVRIDDIAGLSALSVELRVDLVVVGPEAPLCAGLADELEGKGIAVFGPKAAAARIEGSKAFAKQIMAESGVPTAAYAEFSDAGRAADYAAAHAPVAVKADGLAAGKGVILCRTTEEARAAVRSLMVDRAVGEAGKKVIVEEWLDGEEASAIALCDGERYRLLEGSRDHKRLHEGDRGPNTGGMGAISPTRVLTRELASRVGREVIEPTLRTLARRGAPFQGALYAGLMVGSKGPKVLEFNCRFGDPETQPLMLRFDGDLPDTLARCAAGDLSNARLSWRSEAAVAVVLAASGYPGTPRSGDEIRGLAAAESAGCVVFHAGTASAGARITTSGGRVLSVCALGKDLAAARETAYEGVRRIHFDGMQRRSDIGAQEA
jgi:phosphoribosylamine---glycine ligase